MSANKQASQANQESTFAELGDRTRLSLLMRLSRGGPRSIASLSADAELTRQAVTKHLHVLERAGLVTSIRIGRESRFAYRPEPINDVRSFLDDISAGWDEAIGRLQNFLENDENK